MYRRNIGGIEGKININTEQRLEAFEKMLQNVQNRYDDTTKKLEELKERGKVKSVTYNQLLADKLFLQKILDMYDIFGITD